MGEKEMNNNCGVSAVIFGILSIVFSFTVFLGIIFGILALVFSIVQAKKYKNSWSKSGTILSIIGIILSILILFFIVSFVANLQELFIRCTSDPAQAGCEQFAQYLEQASIGGQNLPEGYEYGS